jgi:DNA-binding NtrC family response regulator
VPPLRERWEDVVTYLKNTTVPGTGQRASELLSSEAVALLKAHPWEGNFRELANFCGRLPSSAGTGGVDAKRCRNALEQGALSPTLARDDTPEPLLSALDWAPLAARAIRAFVEDQGREPESWDDQKEWNEKYLKPLVFFHLSGAAGYPAPVDDEALGAIASRCSARAKADRGTALKQLGRYYARFREER